MHSAAVAEETAEAAARRWDNRACPCMKMRPRGEPFGWRVSHLGLLQRHLGDPPRVGGFVREYRQSDTVTETKCRKEREHAHAGPSLLSIGHSQRGASVPYGLTRRHPSFPPCRYVSLQDYRNARELLSASLQRLQGRGSLLIRRLKFVQHAAKRVNTSRSPTTVVRQERQKGEP